MTFKLPDEILIATNNRGKFSEIADLLGSISIKAIPTFEFEIAEPEETGLTFAENSVLKAKYYGQKTGLVSLADDSGLCVEAMNGEPGIYSARFAKNAQGENDFTSAFEKISAQLAKNNFQNCRAFFICNLALFNPVSGFNISFEGRVDGNLIFPPRGNQGFGYDPIFIKDGMDKTFGEIDPQFKDQISHRGIAFKKMVEWLKKGSDFLD